MSLEKVVRPYQTREITPPSVSVPTAMQQANDKPVEIIVGKSWSIKSLNGSETLEVSFYQERWMKEKKAPTEDIEPPTDEQPPADRKYKLKRVHLPPFSNPENYVDIPVITGLQYTDTNGQVFNYKVVNDSTNKTRKVKVKRVKAASYDGVSDSVLYNSDSYVDAERIQVGNFIGTNGQLFRHKFHNEDPAPRTPEAAARLTEDDHGHSKVHYVRYYKDNDDSDGMPWVTVEYIDFLKFLGTNGQIFNYKMRHPSVDNLFKLGSTPRLGTPYGSKIHDDDPYKPILGFADPQLELIPDEFIAQAPAVRDESSSNVPVPLRLDPFQNLVNVFSSESISYVWYYRPSPLFFLPGGSGDDFTQAMNFYPWQGPGINSGQVIPPVPSDVVITGGPVVQGVTWPGTQPWNFTDFAGQALVSWPYHFGSGSIPPASHTTPGGPPWLYLAGPSHPDSTGVPYVTIRINRGDDPTNPTSDPNPSVHHTWQFEALAIAGDVNSGYVSTGSLSTSLGGITLTVKGVPWILDWVSVYMFSWPTKPDPYDPNIAGAPAGITSPVFVASFKPGEPPTG